MAESFLDFEKIDTGFNEMSGVAVAIMSSAALSP
jgi:hypothetical protein